MRWKAAARWQGGGSPTRALALLLLTAFLACSGSEARRTTTEWSAACPLELTTSAAGPVHEWISCEEETGLSGCRRLATQGAITPDPRVRVSSQGEVEIAYGQRLSSAGDSPASRQWVWAGIDGELRVRVVQHDSDAAACTYYVEELRDAALRLGVRGDGKAPLPESPVDGLLDIDREASARVLFRNADREVSRWNGRLRRVAPDRRLERHALGTGARAVQVVHDPARDPDRLGVGAAAPFEIAGRVYFEVGDARQRALLSWTDEEGSRPLRRYTADEDRAAGNLGSDGEWLVWTEAEARDDRGRFQRAWIVAAPAANPGQARRIASDLAPHVGAAPFAVGCGQAGHRVPGGALFVDLESGETFELRDSTQLRWGSVVAISCDDLFVAYAASQGMELARLPRVSLQTP